MGLKLIAVRKDQAGNIIQFMTDEHRTVTFEEARELAQGGQLDSLTDILSDGTWVIDEYGQHIKGSNLADLPEF